LTDFKFRIRLETYCDDLKIPENVASIIKIHAQRVFKEGVPHLQVKKVTTDLSVKDLKFKLTEKLSKLLGEARHI
jgi:hypothetical protein